MRRYTGNMNGERFLGNRNTKRVRDLDKEDKHNCQIDEIIKAGNDVPFSSRQAAHNAGYKDDCDWCI